MKGFGASFAASFAQEYIDRGRAEGRAEGEAREARGEVQGQAKSLIRLLKKRFGRLPPQLRKRISAASVMSIEAWFDRAIDASDLESVFGTETTCSSRPLEHETH